MAATTSNVRDSRQSVRAAPVPSRASILPHALLRFRILASRHLVKAMSVLSTRWTGSGGARVRGVHSKQRRAAFRRGDAHQEDLDHGRGRVHRQQRGALFRGTELERHCPRQSFQGGRGKEPGLAARRHGLRFRAGRRARRARASIACFRKIASMPCCIWRRRWPSRHPWPTRAPILPSMRSAPSTCSTRCGCTAPKPFSSLPRPTRSTARSPAPHRAARQPLRLQRPAARDQRDRAARLPVALRLLEGRRRPVRPRLRAGSTAFPPRSFRQSCIYGPRQFGVEDQGWVAWFVIAAILGRDVTIFGDGKQVRDVLHVDDLLRAYEAAIRAPDKVAQQAFNVGGGPAICCPCSS